MIPVAKAVTAEARIMLQSGSEFDILEPHHSNFTIEDIAHGLSMLCRYVGQCSNFYSIAEHSIHVSDVCGDHALAGLLHDAAEAFIGDVSGPLKALLPAYKRIEKNIEAVIFDKFDIPYPLSSEIKAADLAVLVTEQSQIMPLGTNEWLLRSGVQPANVHIKCLSPNEAKDAFLHRFYKLWSPHKVRRSAFMW